jgi:SAM-dependent methyltransferase
MSDPSGEIERIAERYRRRGERRGASPAFSRCAAEERGKLYRSLLLDLAGGDLSALTLLEVGCGGGSELRRMISLGLRPERLVGNELLPERLAQARASLPATVRLIGGDATALELPDASFDVVFQSTVFTSILDDGLAERLARLMWRLLRPGGAVLWYDFTIDNPRNPDVRGVPASRVASLFPEGEMTTWRVTLAPPIGRLVAPLGGWAYRALAAIPPLRTHLVAWVRKPNVRA